jgi:ATP-dependent DNA helicase Rep
VGDDDQAIYAWRGADVENLRLLRTDYPKLKVIKLEQNYRSMRASCTPPTRSSQQRTPSCSTRSCGPSTATAPAIQVQMVAATTSTRPSQVVMKLSAHRFEHRTKWADYAILYRGNHQARVFEQQLRNQKIPYAISGGPVLLRPRRDQGPHLLPAPDRQQDDDPAFIRAVTTPRRGIGGTTLEALGRYAGRAPHQPVRRAFAPAPAGTPASSSRRCASSATSSTASNGAPSASRPRQVLNDMLRAIGYEAWLFDSCEPREAETKWANVRDFVDWLGRKGEEENKTLLELTQTVALISMLDKADDEARRPGAARHPARRQGPGVQARLPGRRRGRPAAAPRIDRAGKLEEERRLMYVGITRAQRSLTISYCERRKRAATDARPASPRASSPRWAPKVAELGCVGGAGIVTSPTDRLVDIFATAVACGAAGVRRGQFDARHGGNALGHAFGVALRGGQGKGAGGNDNRARKGKRAKIRRGHGRLPGGVVESARL